MVPDGLIDIFATLCAGGFLTFTLARLYLSHTHGYIAGHRELARIAREPGDGLGLAAALVAYGLGIGVAGVANRFADDSKYFALDAPMEIRRLELHDERTYTPLGAKILVARERAVSEALDVAGLDGRVRPDCGAEPPFIPLSGAIAQIYYTAKNAVYAIDSHAVELTRIADQIDFVRTTFYLLLGSLGLEFLCMLLAWVCNRPSPKGCDPDEDTKARLRAVIITGLLVWGFSTVYVHLQEQYTKRIFGYWAATLEPDAATAEHAHVRPVKLALPPSIARPPRTIADLELSAATTYSPNGDTVLLAPEEPNKACVTNGGFDACLYRVPSADVVRAARCGVPARLTEVALDGPGGSRYQAFVDGWLGQNAADWEVEGIEGLTFLRQDQLALLVEVKRKVPPAGWSALLCTATVQPESDGRQAVRLTGHCSLLPEPGDAPNLGYEALAWFGGKDLLLALPERLNHAPPLGFRIDAEGGITALGPAPAPDVPFRVTDAAVANEKEVTWGVNYYYPGEAEYTWPFPGAQARVGDSMVDRTKPFARLFRTRRDGDGLAEIDHEVPIPQFGATGENWEGLAILDDRHLLLVADRFGEETAAVVALPPSSPSDPW